jgi:hypothetical protein
MAKTTALVRVGNGSATEGARWSLMVLAGLVVGHLVASNTDSFAADDVLRFLGTRPGIQQDLTASAGEAIARDGGTSSRGGLTEEQRRFVAWGEERFAAAGLTLRVIEYVFHEDLEACGWHGGLFSPGTGVVVICNGEERTLIHELAHAWEAAYLSDQVRAEFMELRGLDVWNHRDVPWSERAAEQAAEVITWGVEEKSRLVEWVEPDGRRTFRLLTIPNSSVEELVAAYRLLTGMEPILRHSDEWQQVERSDFSPEMLRASTPAAGR